MSGSCSGGSSGGSLTQLLALGALDQYLSQSPSITYWRYRYNKHTNFSMEDIEQPFTGNVGFGGDVQVLLNRTGDLIYYQYVVIDLPGIKSCAVTPGVCGVGSQFFPCCDPCDETADGASPICECGIPPPVPPTPETDPVVCTGLVGPWCHWTNAIGQFLVKRACIVIGGQIIDTLYNDYLFMWEELAGKPGKRLREMIGKRFTRAGLVADSMEHRRLYVPLPFWYTLNSGNSLPLVSLQFHSVQINVTFEELRRCVQRSDCTNSVVKCSDCSPLSNSDLNARLTSTYIFLDVVERDKFATGCFEQLICQVQNYTLCTKSCQVRLQLNFNHAVIELIWAVRRRKHEVCNSHFNFSGVFGRDPVRMVQLRLNNLPRFSGREGRYFRLVQPYQFHSLIPRAFVYCYSFAVQPEEPQPSGSCNFSRIDNAELILDLQEDLVDEEVVVIVFARNWNILKMREGLGGLAYAS